MNTLTSWQQTLDIVREDSRINLIATAVTPWNALSIDALLSYLSDLHINIHAIIVIAEHYQAGYMIDEGSFSNTCSEYYRLPYSDKTQNRTLASKIEFLTYYRNVFNLTHDKSPILYYVTFNHTIPDILIAQSVGERTKRRICVCHSEEGVGAYMGTFDKTYPKFRDIHSIGEFRSFVRYSLFGKTIYRSTHKTYNSLTLKDSWSGLAINQGIVPYYHKIFSKKCLNIDFGLEKEEIAHSVVICTTAWRRNEIIDDEDTRVLTNVCEYLTDKNIKLLLKPHPRDKHFITIADYLHCKILAVGSPIEIVCEYAQPRAIISFSSTTLVNPAIFWNIPTFCLTGMLNREKISDFYLDEIDSFKRTFGNFVKHVRRCEDIQISE